MALLNGAAGPHILNNAGMTPLDLVSRKIDSVFAEEAVYELREKIAAGYKGITVPQLEEVILGYVNLSSSLTLTDTMAESRSSSILWPK